MPYQEAALNTSSILEYLLVAEDEDGKKLDPEVVFQDVSTMLGAGQVTTSSALSWVSGMDAKTRVEAANAEGKNSSEN